MHRRRARRSRPARATAGNRKASSSVLSTNHDEDEACKAEDRGHAAGADEIHGRAAVFAGGRIVVITEEKNGVAGVADLAGRGFDESETKVARFVLEAVEVA